jgi:tRNA (guanine37-N1)-methyltransferase
VVAAALAEVQQDTPPPDESILLTPAGERATQGTMETLASRDHICLVAGRYEGFDARAERRFDRHLSIGDYVLMGGELPALVVLEAVARLLPGVLGDADSHRQDSFSSGLLDYPQYTRPATFEGEAVPDVLTSGHHGKVEAWRRLEALKRTAQLRPDLIDTKKLTPDERAWLDAFLSERDVDRDA